MDMLCRPSRQQLSDQFQFRDLARRIIAVISMTLAFMTSVVTLEYLLGEGQTLKSAAQSITQNIWPWLRAAGLWSLAATLLIVSFLILMIKQIPDNRNP